MRGFNLSVVALAEELKKLFSKNRNQYLDFTFIKNQLNRGKKVKYHDFEVDDALNYLIFKNEIKISEQRVDSSVIYLYCFVRPKEEKE